MWTTPVIGADPVIAPSGCSDISRYRVGGGISQAERHQILQWMFWSGEQWRIFATTLFNQRVANRLMDKPENPSIVELAISNIRAVAKVLDAHLADRQFIVGDHLTLADIDIAAPFSQSARTKVPFAEYPNLAAWQQRLLDTLPS
ncbi:glutathione S-transferase family protein [Sphingomonas sp. PB2P19]|uniref:glutathione S-transferase family protein n=1 Tax=Sphingomonas rhamnosi TaxID=3096156 RepID=UPI002FCA7517